MSLTLRRRLIAIVVLSAVACAGALFSITLLVRNDRESRTERAREVITRELERLRAGEEPVPWRGRWARGERRVIAGRVELGLPGGALRLDAPPGLRPLRDEALGESQATGALAFRERETPSGATVVGVSPDGRGGFVWASMRVLVPRAAKPWRWGVGVLALATLALVFASVHTLVTLGRGLSSLRASLRALSQDLRAVVERPALGELREVAEGIASLASDLQKSQDARASLSVELAAQERLAALGRVTAGVAHEVRNPLASIKLRADLAQRVAGVPVQVARDLGEISSEVARLDRLVADLLVMSGRRTGPRVTTDLAELARKRVALLAPWASSHGISLSVEGEGHASVDVDAVARVVDNLVRNAVEASLPGASVQVSVTRADRRVTLAVLDRGQGVTPEHEPKLFEPFFTTKGEGTGLGLPLSRAIAAAHGGTLTFRREGGVTRFELNVPGVESPPEER